MKIRQWLGYNEDASQYLLRPGELRILNNLQSRRPGMLISRRGLTKIYGKYDDETIYGLYRRATILGNPSDFLWFQKVLVERDLTAAQLLAQEYGFEYVWMVRRVEGNQSRIIDTLPISQIKNMCVAEDRHGRMFLFYGHGTRPRIYRPTDLANVALPMGMDAPLVMPSVIPSGQGYFIEGVDVAFGGGSYYEPPTLTLTGGNPDRPAKLKAIVQTGNVIGVDIVDGGANYKTPPRIEASVDKVGTGFRARGNIVNSARTISGFDQTREGTITGSLLTNTQTYGATGGTANNSILYLSSSPAVTERVITASGATITLPSVVGIQVGDTVTMYPTAAPFTSGPVTVTLVNTTTKVVTLSAAGFTPAPSTIYEATFRRPSQIGQAAAEYDSTSRRFTATIPLASASTTGKGAHATLEFSPLPRGYGLNASGSSTRLINRNWQTYRNGAGVLVPFLYGEYWGGSDFDLKGSSENALYGGLQASRMSFVRGFSGSLNGRRADVYWPDYSKISVWFCTGTYTQNTANWRRADVTVETEIDPNTNIPAKVLRFRLKPTRKAKTVKALAGSSISTDDEPYDEFPDAVAPEVKLYLTECPDSWLVDRDFCLPKARKEIQNDRLPWFSPNTLVPRPIVDITPAGVPVSKDSVVITDPGSGWAKNTVFAFRIYQANSYAQSIDYNTAVVEDRRRVPHEAFFNRYVEFVFNATTPDSLAPHGPPHTLITPAQVSLPGDGYGTGATGTITLYKRGLDDAVSAAVPGQTITWQATTLDTLSATSAGYIGSITILNKGRNYFAPPTIEVRGGGNGYGLSVLPTVENGRIESVQIIDPGLSYTASPELFTTSRAAQLTAVMRPALRGKYRCAYRFADRSETVLGTISVNRTRESNTVLAISGTPAVTVKPDMLLEAPELPRNCRVKSVNGNLVEVNQEVTGMAFSGPAVWSAVPLADTTQRSANGGSSLFAATLGLRTLRSGEQLSSPSLRYRLTMQTDGNLVLYDDSTVPATAVWNTATFVAGSTASILNSGAFVVQSPTGTTLWTSGTTAPAAGSVLEVLDSGTIAIFPPSPIYTVTVRDLTKPIAYSDLSPIKDVDCGPNDERTHASKLEWSLTGVTPPDRADTVELWRTSADQSLVFYRVEAYGVPSAEGIEIVGDDTLTDEELFDPERPNYAAMPIVLPNGNVNAYRFGKPRDDMSVAVAFQDRLWMAVSTSGKDPNTLYYSEFDEFESFPDVNELPIQNNQKNTDTLTALVPFGSMLLAMQHTHTYAVAYNTDPAVDGTIQMMAHRGCLHQRAWDMHENVLYAADESGIYSMSRQGEVTDISLPIRDFFVSELLDYGKRDTFFLQADPRTHILRFFCTLKSNPTDTPAFAVCYDIQAKTWWTESYPNSLTAACTGRPSDARVSTILLGGVDGNLYEIAGDSDHANDALTDTFVTEGGSGYREAPPITVPNVEGAIAQGVVSEGRLVDVIIQNAGWGASWGIGLLAEDGNPIAASDGRELKGVEYDAIQLDIGPPVPGGTQAVAYANFSVTPLVRRLCTVSQGQDYVRLKPKRIVAAEAEVTLPLAAESALILTTEANAEIRIEAPAVEVGMEAIGPFIPLNAFVSRIDGPNIYLSHPDGSPALNLFGDPRVYSPPAGETWLDQQDAVTLTYTTTGELRANESPVLFDGIPLTLSIFAASGYTPRAAERINGVNQLLSRNNTTGQALVWAMSDSWEFLCQLGLHSPGSPEFLATEVAFRCDIDGNGLVGAGPDWPDYGGTEMEVQFRKPVRTHIPFRMATGFMQLINEDNAKGGDALVDRSVTLVYTPTPSDKEVEIIERFNGRDEMRANLMRRDRGGPGGFIHRQDSASTVLNTSREASHLGFATGVAKAKFASRVYTDMTGEDQHLQVELYGRPEQASPWERTNFWNPDPSIHTPYQFVLHSMTVNGVAEDAE